jgi:micrococcal nuclease
VSKYNDYMYTYNAELIRVVDGDTVKCRVDLGFRLYRDITLRLSGINAYELKTEAGKIAKLALTNLLTGQKFIVHTSMDPESYDRYTAVVIKLEDGLNVNEWLVKNGHAVDYDYKWD